MSGNKRPSGQNTTRRKRGGQPGNQNARKHGFYSHALNPSELCELWNIINLEAVDPPVAVLRVKLQSLLRQDPTNRRVLMAAEKLLAKYYQAKFGLDKTNTQSVKMVLRYCLQNQLARPQQNATSQNQSERILNVCHEIPFHKTILSVF